MKAWIGAVALIGTLACESAVADGNKFLENCQEVVRHMDNKNAKTENLMGMGQCFGMLEGVRSTLIVVNESLPPDVRFCFPKEGISNGQAARIVTKYLRENPAELHLPEAFLVISAYQEAFPCK